MKQKIIIFSLLILLQSCVSIPKEHRNPDCSKIDQELDLRYDLFAKLSRQEITKRQKINVPTYSALGDLSVFSKIIEAVLDAPNNAKMIPVDLRSYRNVELGNIVFSNRKNRWLGTTLNTSKYSQGFFVLINFSPDSITISPPPNSPFWNHQKIATKNLQNAEIIINISDSVSTLSNMKFAPNMKVSIIADRIKNPYRLDLREMSNMQFNLGNRWLMPMFSIEDSSVEGGKDTTGFFKFVNNRNARKMDLHKFYKSEVGCYRDVNGKKFREILKDK
ncbi:MAG: hypothetical protein ACJA0S_000244 [Rickettsiales bacterium]|jgi:hypothetical protein